MNTTCLKSKQQRICNANTVLLLIFLFALTVCGATKTWTGGGGDNNWSTAANWGGTAPVANDSLAFGGSTRLTPNNNLAAATSFAAVTFNSGAGAFVIGGASFTLAGSVTNNSTNAQTIGTAIVMTAIRTFNCTSGNLALTGVVSGIGGGISKNGASTLTLSGVNTYTGGTTALAGTLVIDNNKNAFGTGPVTLYNLTTVRQTNFEGNAATGGWPNAIVLNSGIVTFDVPFAAGKDIWLSQVVSGSGGINVTGEVSSRTLTLMANNTFSGGVTTSFARVSLGHVNALGTGALTVSCSSGSGYLESEADLSAGVPNNISIASTKYLNVNAKTSNPIKLSGIISGAGGVYVNGSSTTTFSGANTYTGSTTLQACTLAAGSIQAFGVNSAVTLANVAGVNLNITGFSNAIGSLTGGGVIGGSVNLGAATLTIGGNNSSPATYGGNISGTGGLTKTGTGTLTLSGTNTYTGGTSVAGGTLAAGSGQAFGVNSAVSMSNVAGANLNIAGYAITIGSLTGGGTTGGNVTLGAANLTIGGNNTSPAAYGGLISGTGGFTKIGTGTLILANNNTFTGAVTINAGTLSVLTLPNSVNGAIGPSSAITINSGGTISCNNPNALVGWTPSATQTLQINSGGLLTNPGTPFATHLPAVILNGGSITATSAEPTYSNWSFDYTVSTLGGSTTSTISGGNCVLNQVGGTKFSIAAGDNLNLSSIITPLDGANEGMIKQGAGTLTLNASNTYTRATTINAGTLIVNGTTDVNSPFTVQAGATLAGTGTVKGTITLIGSGIIAPGNSNSGTLSTGTLALNANSVLTYNLNTVSDKIAVTGNLVLDGTLNVTAGAGFNDGAFTIMSYTGSLTNNGLTLGTIPAGYTARIVAEGGLVTLIMDENRFNYVEADTIKGKALELKETNPDIFFAAYNHIGNDGYHYNFSYGGEGPSAGDSKIDRDGFTTKTDWGETKVSPYGLNTQGSIAVVQDVQNYDPNAYKSTLLDLNGMNFDFTQYGIGAYGLGFDKHHGQMSNSMFALSRVSYGEGEWDGNDTITADTITINSNAIFMVENVPHYGLHSAMSITANRIYLSEEGFGVGTPGTTEITAGSITTSKVVTTPKWKIPDYVFEKGYKLQSLESVEKFVQSNKHLPNVPSAQDIKDKGMDLSEMNVKLLEKVEELTLHMIEMDKEIKTLKSHGRANVRKQ